MADEQEQQEPNADVRPPGSSESFNEFKDRVLTAMSGYAADNEGHNTAYVTHSKFIGTVLGAEHAGWPEDQSIHMPTYEEVKDKAPGSHEEISIPEHIRNFFLGPWDSPISKTARFMQQQAEGAPSNVLEAAQGIVKGAIDNPSQFALGMATGGGMKGSKGVLSKEATELALARAKKNVANQNEPEEVFKGHPFEAFLENVKRMNEKDPYEEAVRKQGQTFENTIAGADRNQYPLTYRVKDEDVSKELDKLISSLEESRRTWKEEWNHGDPEMFDKEFRHTIDIKNELMDRDYELKYGRPSPFHKSFLMTPEEEELIFGKAYEDPNGPKNIPAKQRANPDDKITAEVGSILPQKIFNTGNERADKILDSVINKGMKYSEAAEEHGVSRNTVAGVVSRFNNNPDTYSPSGVHGRYKRVTDEQWDVIKSMADKGVDHKDIAKAVGLAESTIARNLKRTGGSSGTERKAKNLPTNKEGYTIPDSVISDWVYEYDKEGNLIGKSRTIKHKDDK